MDLVPLFVSDRGLSYRLFIHNCPEKEKVADLIEYGFGTVESCPVGENTLVLAAPGFPAGRNEVFSIEYITACCSRRKKLNITDFRLNKTSEYNADFNPMDVLEGILTWSEAEKYRSRSVQVSQSSFPANDSSDRRDDDTHMETSSPLRRQRQYTLAHETDILEFVVRHGAYEMVKGAALWKKMEEKKMCGGRTWQSLREHFLKKILPAIDSFNLSETQITRFRNVNCNNSGRSRQKQNLMNSMFQGSNDKLNRRTGASSTESNTQISLYTEHPDGQEGQCVIRNTNYYTEAEDMNLLKFIAQHKRYKAAGGVRLWKLMERKKAVPGRSWQSMKERYRKVLIHKLDEYLPCDVATKMLEADLGGIKQRTNKRRALAAPHSLSPQTHTQMTEPDTSVSQIYSACPKTNCSSLSSSTNTNKSFEDDYVFPCTSTPNKRESILKHNTGSKRKLFSQKKCLMALAPASESGKSTHSSEYQSAAVVQVHHSQESSKKLGMSKESSVLEKEGNLLKFRGTSAESALDSASNECNLNVVSGTGTDSEINVHLPYSNSEQEEVGRNDVRNVPTDEQAVLSEGRKTRVMSYKREKEGEVVNDNILENMPDKEIAVQSKSSRPMLQGHSVTEKFSCDRSQDEVMSEKTSCEQNVQDLSDKESLSKGGNFTQKILIFPESSNTNTPESASKGSSRMPPTQDLAVNVSEGPECSDKELPGSSSLDSGSSIEVSGSTHVSGSKASVSSYMEMCSDVVPAIIIENGDKPFPEQPTHCCSSQVLMSPLSSLPPEETPHSYDKGFAAHQVATTRKYADVIDMEQPVSSAHSNTGSCDWCESSTENSDSPAQGSDVFPEHDLSETCCSLSSSTAYSDKSSLVLGDFTASKKLEKLLRSSSVCAESKT